MLRRPSKGIKILKSCYPEKDTPNQNLTVVSHKLEDLFKYILLNPQKLSEIGKYLEKRTKRDLYKGQYGFVKISLSIFNSIIQSSQSNMFTFYAPYAVSVMQEIFSVEANFPSMPPATVASFKVIATETFVRFSKARYNNNITEYQDVGYFLNYFIDMCNPSTKLDNETKLKLRFCGLKGIYNYITTVDDIDAFVAKYIDRIDVNKTGIMNAILSFLLEFDSFAKTIRTETITESDREKENETGIYVLSFSCLGELSKPASATTLKSLLFAVLDFFSVHKAWSQPEFVHNCIKALAVKPQHNQTILSQLLFYLDMVPENRMKIHVVKTISFFFDEIGRAQTSSNDNSAATGGTGPVIEVLIPLIRQLTLVNDSDVSDNEDKDIESYENAIIQALGSAARKVVDPSEKLEAIGYIMDKIRGHKAAHITSVLLQCVLQVAFHLKELPFSKAVPSKIFEPLLSLSTNNDPTVRVIVQQIFHCLLQLHSSHRASVTLLSKTMEQDERTEKRNHAIRLSLFKQALLENNQPENFTAIYQTFCLLLQLYRSREIELSFPILFKLESLATEETIAPHLGRCIHCVVGAYLLQVAKLYGSNMLEEYISQTMLPEWSRYVKLNDQDEFIAKKKKFSKKKVKLEERVKTPIDRERVATVLSQTHLVKELSGKDFKQALMQEMTQDDQSEVINNITSTPGFTQQGTNEEISNNNVVISSASSRKRQGSSVDMILVKDFPIKYKFDDLKIIFEPAQNNNNATTPQVPEPAKPTVLSFQTVASGCEIQTKERLQTLSQVFEMVPVLCELSDAAVSLENITFPKLFHILDLSKEKIAVQ